MSDEHTSTKRVLQQLRNYVKEMDARITIARCEIREKNAAVDQLENEKLALDHEIDRIEKNLNL